MQFTRTRPYVQLKLILIEIVQFRFVFFAFNYNMIWSISRVSICLSHLLLLPITTSSFLKYSFRIGQVRNVRLLCLFKYNYDWLISTGSLTDADQLGYGLIALTIRLDVSMRSHRNARQLKRTKFAMIRHYKIEICVGCPTACWHHSFEKEIFCSKLQRTTR